MTAKLVLKRKKAPPQAPEPRSKRREDDSLPHSAEAERGVLGSILNAPAEALAVAREHLPTPHFFYVPANAAIYQCLLDQWDGGAQIDLITFTQFLRDRKLLDKVGGPGYVTELFTFVPTAANIKHYIEIVREKFLRREMIAAGNRVMRAAYGATEDVNDAIDVLRKQTDQIVNGLNGQGRLPSLVDVCTRFGDNQPVPPPEIIRNVLHQGSKIVLGGTSKGRKTFALIDMALSIASGAQWWGFQCKRAPVCYINFEIQESFFCQRVEVIAKTKGIVLEPGQLLVWNLRGYAQGMERLMDDILMTLCARQFGTVIIDPVYKGLGGRDENKAGDVASLCNELELIAVKTGAAVAFGAHYSKGNQALKESMDRIGGSGVFARDPDSILTMTPHDEFDAFTVEATLRNFKPIKPFVVRWDWPLFRRDEELDPDKLKSARGGNPGQFKAKFTKEMLLDHLSIAAGLTVVKLRSLVDKRTGMGKSTFYNFKAELLEQGLMIERDGELFRAPKKLKVPTDSNGITPPMEEPLESEQNGGPF